MSTLLLAAGLVGVFGGIFLALTAIGVFTNEASGVSKSLSVLEAFSSAPAEMRNELEPGFEERVLTPLLDRTLGIGRKLTPADHAERIRHKLEVAGNPPGWTVDRVTSLKFVGFAAALVLGLLFTRVLGLGFLPTLGGVMLLSVAGYMAPNMYLYQKGYDRTQKIERALARRHRPADDLRGVRASASTPRSPRWPGTPTVRSPRSSRACCRRCRSAWAGLPRSAPSATARTSPDVKGFVSSMVQADALGIPVAHVLRVQSREIRTKRRQRAEEQAQKVAIKILIPLIFCILPCLFIAVLGPAGISMVEAFSGRM